MSLARLSAFCPGPSLTLKVTIQPTHRHGPVWKNKGGNTLRDAQSMKCETHWMDIPAFYPREQSRQASSSLSRIKPPVPTAMPPVPHPLAVCHSSHSFSSVSWDQLPNKPPAPKILVSALLSQKRKGKYHNESNVRLPPWERCPRT